ncbi:MAG: hypothetical protein FIB02_08885 [Desulfuromonas sp.]|nr:hypothetical protein [Desulfuromonas sp.]
MTTWSSPFCFRHTPGCFWYSYKKQGVKMLRIQLVLIIICVALASAGFAETRIFDLNHRRAADVAEAVRTVLGDEAKVTAVDRSLVVNASAAELTGVAELISRLDRPARMLRVYVAQDQQDRSQVNSFGGSIEASSGNSTVIIGGRPTAHPPTHGGATVVLGGDHGMMVGSAQTGSRVESRRSEQFLVTLEGSPARISVGRRIPFTEQWLVLTRRHTQIVDSTRYETVDTGFEVVPEFVAGNQVELAIHPFMAFIDPRHDREIRFLELTTRVRIPMGEWFDLGGTMSGKDEVSREILATGSKGQGEDGHVRIRVELQPN